MSPRGGRPRDPELQGKVIAAAIELLASKGQLHGDEIAAAAGVGKASIYRRWDSLDELLVEVVRELGVRDVDHGEGPGDLRADLTRVLHASAIGVRAAAERAVLPLIGKSDQLQVAWLAGPAGHLVEALQVVETRSRSRGEPAWPSYQAPSAALRLLQHWAMVHADPPNLLDVAAIVDSLVLPILAGRA